MPLTPDEVRAHCFRSSLLGYRTGEVRSFLNRVAADYEQAIEAIAEAAYLPNRQAIDAMLRAANESAQGLRRAATMVAIGNRSEFEPLMAQAAEVMDQAADLLEQARDWATRFGAHPARTVYLDAPGGRSERPSSHPSIPTFDGK
jgi:DivIVA domain-containing protein